MIQYNDNHFWYFSFNNHLWIKRNMEALLSCVMFFSHQFCSITSDSELFNLLCIILLYEGISIESLISSYYFFLNFCVLQFCLSFVILTTQVEAILGVVDGKMIEEQEFFLDLDLIHRGITMVMAQSLITDMMNVLFLN